MNGVYEPTSEVSSGGVTVYWSRKVGDANMQQTCDWSTMLVQVLGGGR